MSTSTGTIMTISNSIIGVSVLAMPFCFKECGIALSIVLLLISSIVSRLTCYLLLKSAVMARRRNFEFLAFHVFGPTGKFVAELCIIGFLMGTCIAFFVVVGDLGPAIISKLLGIDNTTALRPAVLIGLAVLVVLPLGLLRNVDSLSSVCTATIGFYLCLVFKVFVDALPHLLSGVCFDKVNFWRPAGILQCLPIFSMALFCQTQLFEIYDALPNPSLERMNGAVRAAINLCTCVYVSVGFFGYIAFCSQNFGGNILMSFAPTIMSDMIKLGFVLSVAVSFPLVIFPCRASLYSLLFRRTQNPHHEMVATFIPEAKFKCITVFIIGVSLAIGLVIPNIELVLGLVGSTIGVGICVIFPALAFIFVSTKETTERIIAQILLFVGVLVLVLGSYANLYAANEAVKMPEVGLPMKLPDIPIKLPDVQEKLPVADLVEVKDVANLVGEVNVIRKEPPVPVEPVADKVPDKVVEVPIEQKENKVEVEKTVKEEKGVDEVGERAKVKSEEVIDKDALKKEDEELADAEKQAVKEANQKNEELLRKLEKHQEEQKKLLKEQKEILQVLKEQKIENAKEKEENNPSVKKEAEFVEPAKKSDKEQLLLIQSLDAKQQEQVREIVQGELQILDKLNDLQKDKVFLGLESKDEARAQEVKDENRKEKVDKKGVKENEVVAKQSNEILPPANKEPVKYLDQPQKEPIAYQQRYLNNNVVANKPALIDDNLGVNKPVLKNLTMKTLIMPPANLVKSVPVQSEARQEVKLEAEVQKPVVDSADDAMSMRRDILEANEREKRDTLVEEAVVNDVAEKATVVKEVDLSRVGEEVNANGARVKDVKGEAAKETVVKEVDFTGAGAEEVNAQGAGVKDGVAMKEAGDDVAQTADITILGEVREQEGVKDCQRVANIEGEKDESVEGIIKIGAVLADPVVKDSIIDGMVLTKNALGDEIKPMSRDLKSVDGKTDDRNSERKLHERAR